MNQVHQFFNITKKSNLLIIIAEESILKKKIDFLDSL
jgi:hypothetical protein